MAWKLPSSWNPKQVFHPSRLIGSNATRRKANLIFKVYASKIIIDVNGFRTEAARRISELSDWTNSTRSIHLEAMNINKNQSAL